MEALVTYEFAVGLAIGKILIGAALASRLFRSLVLASFAAGVIYTYVMRGVGGLLKIATLLQTDAMAHPKFGYGVAVGALTVAFVGFALRNGRSA